MKKFLNQCFSEKGIPISETQLSMFVVYLEMLQKYNQMFNLTSITEDHAICVKHFLDSAMVSQFFNLKPINTVIDVGTGGGFPGIPLKILFPHLKVALLDSLQKRVSFLSDVISELHLERICAVHGRSEDLAHDSAYRERFDLSISRAVANLPVLSEYCLPFVKVGGNFIAMKGSHVEEEIVPGKRAIAVLGGEIKEALHYELKIEHLQIDHSLLIISKKESTKQLYPRAPKKIKETPLG